MKEIDAISVIIIGGIPITTLELLDIVSKIISSILSIILKSFLPHRRSICPTHYKSHVRFMFYKIFIQPI